VEQRGDRLSICSIPCRRFHGGSCSLSIQRVSPGTINHSTCTNERGRLLSLMGLRSQHFILCDSNRFGYFCDKLTSFCMFRKGFIWDPSYLHVFWTSNISSYMWHRRSLSSFYLGIVVLMVRTGTREFPLCESSGYIEYLKSY
jgi:hypothetical protein